MNGNDIVEMESMTEEMEGDTDADMIEEDVGERSLPFEEEQLYKSMKRWIVFRLTVKEFETETSCSATWGPCVSLTYCLRMAWEPKRQNSKVKSVMMISVPTVAPGC